jgi:glycosyltransferase involved in cell wall biosynthesis
MLTVVIPHFNHGATVGRAVKSALSSKVADIEILVVDDGSTDGSQTVLAALEQEHPTVRVIYLEKIGGAPVALNAGLAEARGEFISFLGSDDFVFPELYPTMVSNLESYPAAAIACGPIAIVGLDGRILGVRPFSAPTPRACFLDPHAVARLSEKSDNWICNTAAVYRTEMLRRVGGYEVSLGAFCDGFASRLLAFTRGFVFVPGIFGVWQVAPKTLSASTILNLDESKRLMDQARQKLAASPIGHLAPFYPDTFVRRLRYSAARMHFFWHGARTDVEQVMEIADCSESDRKVFDVIHSVVGSGQVGRLTLLAWLAWRLQPISKTTGLLDLIRNKIAVYRNRKRVEEMFASLTQPRPAASSAASAPNRN